MSHRFRFIGEMTEEGSWILREDEAHHASKVLRLKDGDVVEVTDGVGNWCVGKIKKIASAIHVDVEAAHFVKPHDHRREIFVGALKHHWIEDTIASVVETGVSGIRVYGQRHTDKFLFEKKFSERICRLIENACKQSRQTHFPDFKVYKNLSDALASCSSDSEGVYFNMGASTSYLHHKLGSGPRFGVIGSEGGFDDEDLKILADSKLPLLSLGDLTLRALTAAIVASSYIAS